MSEGWLTIKRPGTGGALLTLTLSGYRHCLTKIRKSSANRIDRFTDKEGAFLCQQTAILEPNQLSMELA